MFAKFPACVVAPRLPAIGTFHRQRGVTSIEYALLGSLIAVAIVAAVQTLGLTVSDFYAFLADEVGSAVSAGGN